MRFFPALVLLAGGCLAPPEPDRLAAEYVELAFALGERDPLYLDHAFGPPPKAEPLALPTIGRRASRLLARAGDDPRSRRVADGLRAMLARVDRLRGRSRPVAEELRLIYGLRLELQPRDEATLARLHAEVERNFPGIAPLAVRVRRRSERIPRATDGILADALTHCQGRLPFGDLRIRWMSSDEWRAAPIGPTPYYRAGVLSLPRGLPLGNPEARRLICHEGAHHFQAELAAARFHETGRAELGIVPLHHPRTAVWEGLAARAERLGAPPAPEAALEPVVLAILAGYLDGELSRLDALRALMFEALVPDAHGILDHADRFGVYALARPAADPAFAAAIERVFAEESLEEATREAMSPAELIALFPPPS